MKKYILGENNINLQFVFKFNKIMPEKETYKHIYNKKDINKNCKYCRKTDRKDNFSDYAYGFECILKRNKRNCNRCKSCYFGH